MNRFALIPLLLLAAIAATAQTNVKTRPAPEWATVGDYPQNPRDTVGSGGYYYLLTELQEHVEKQESYCRRAIKVLTTKGLSQVSYLAVNYDPSYQQLYFHRLLIRRGGKDINILPSAKFELLRREENMDRQVYDKTLDAILNIEDVQVGDIVEYSYTVRGYNPVFSNKAINTFRLNFGVPVARSVVRILCDPARKIDLKKFSSAADPIRDKSGSLETYTWASEHIPAVNVEDNVPDWHRVYDAIEISEFNSWGEVSAWAMPLYTQVPADQKSLDAKVADIKANHLLQESQVQAAIRFVQDEVRYLSFSDGIQGYKPHDPSVVLKQRFGDCKDKSLLLVTMLRQLGVTANPALVNSTTGKRLDQSLPSPYVFDHCIAQFVFNDTTYWVDPTVSLERGSFRKSRNGGYHKALIIAPSTTDLTPILVPEVPSSLKIYETYSFQMIGGSAELTVKTIYAGAQANSIRSYFKSSDKEEIKRNYTNFYANEYPEIAMIDYVTYTDNEKENIIESTEHYEIENFWTRDSTSGVQTTEFYARMIAQYFERPSTKVRKMPFALSHPVSVIQNITIHVPEYWPVKKSSSKVTSPGFSFTAENDYVDEKIFLRYTYDSRKDHITAGEAVKHSKDCDRALNELSFQLTYTPQSAQAATVFNTPFLLIGIFVTLLAVLGLIWLYKYDPRSRNYEISYDGFGGWLVLPVIGIFLMPVLVLIEFARTPYFNYVQWQILTDPTYSGYNPKLGVLILLEYLYAVLKMSYGIFLIVLMVKRRTSFPLFATIIYGMNLLFICFDAVALKALGMSPDSEQVNGIVRTLIAALIWIPYIIFSDRVKGTFTERLQS